MTRILNLWLFVNYCGQKIGQFKGADMRNSLLNVLVSQVVPFINILLVFLYISIGFRNFYIFLPLMVSVVCFTKIFLSKCLTNYLLIDDLEAKYKLTPKNRRFLNFVLAIALTGGAIIIFGCSLFMLKWLK